MRPTYKINSFNNGGSDKNHKACYINSKRKKDYKHVINVFCKETRKKQE